MSEVKVLKNRIKELEEKYANCIIIESLYKLYYLAKYKVDNLGVFATQNIGKHELISMYPVELKKYEFDLAEDIMGHSKMLEDQKYLDHIINDTSNNKKDEYIKIIKQKRNVKAQSICKGKYIVIISTKEIREGEELVTGKV